MAWTGVTGIGWEGLRACRAVKHSELVRCAHAADALPYLHRSRVNFRAGKPVVARSAVASRSRQRATISGKDFNGLRHLREIYRRSTFKRGGLFYSAIRSVPFDEQMVAVRLALFWSV